MPSRRFLLDANVLITAARQYYPFDLAPKFWSGLAEQARSGTVQSIDKVRDELLRGYKKDPDDELYQWTQGEFSDAFATSSDEKVMAAYAQIIQWAESQNQFTEAAKAEFAGCADGWLVAHAKAHGYVVVTLEKYSRDVRKRVLIPNVCKAFAVECMNTLTMLRELRITLS